MVQFKKTLLGLAFGLTASISAHAFDATNPVPPAPAGWNMVENYKNVKIYRKSGENTYVQLVDMVQGGHVRLFQYQGTPSGGFNTYWKGDINYWWNQDSDNRKVSVINGQFFNMTTDPTVLSFGLKSGGVIEPGGDNGADPDYPHKQINFAAQWPWVSNWTTNSLSSSPNANAIVGLDRRTNKSSADSSKGRTYLCAKPYFSKALNQNTTLLVVYSSDAKSQPQADVDLNNWGCPLENTVMMDGGGSSKLKTLGGKAPFVPDDSRKVPQAIMIYN